MTIIEEKAKKYDMLLELAQNAKYTAIVENDKIIFLDKDLKPAKPEDPDFQARMCKVEATTIVLEYNHRNPRTVCNRNGCFRIP